MKQLNTTEKVIGENTFYIKPFPAFTSVNISGELAAVLSPVLGAIAPVIGGAVADKTADDKEDASILDMDIEKAIPALATAFSSVSGDRLERLMKRLLIDHKNVSVEGEITEGRVRLLTPDLANEVFCEDVQDMFILCFEVIKLNFKGFFKKISTLSGNLDGMLQNLNQTSENTETSTSRNSRTSK